MALMKSENDPKKKIRMIDLALAAGRKRQSPRTGLIHYFPEDERVSDVIPIFENFCFVLALLKQKNSECVLEAKQILERLLHFQTSEGNFPLYIHDYPKAWDSLLFLKIAPVLFYILRDFSSILGLGLKEKVEKSLDLGLDHIEKVRLEKPLSLLWENRYLALKREGVPSPFQPHSDSEWFEWTLTQQMGSQKIGSVPYHPSLQFLETRGRAQEKGEARPAILEWALGESEGYRSRLSKDHPYQIYTALLSSFDPESSFLEKEWIETETSEGFQVIWGKESIYSFCLPKGKTIPIPLEESPAKGDLVEVEAFCTLGAKVRIEGKTGTLFHLGQWVQFEAEELALSVRFHLVDGEGEFSGHISKGNRPSQISCKGPSLYEVYDWRIALRTLRKSTPCRIYAEVVIGSPRQPQQFSQESDPAELRCNEGLSTASPMA